MAPPSALTIATLSVKRLVKEELSYRKELAGQEARVKKLEGQIQSQSADMDQNAEFMLKQEVSKKKNTLTLLPSFTITVKL
jgi:tubulin-specific chaperone A